MRLSLSGFQQCGSEVLRWRFLCLSFLRVLGAFCRWFGVVQQFWKIVSTFIASNMSGSIHSSLSETPATCVGEHSILVYRFSILFPLLRNLFLHGLQFWSFLLIFHSGSNDLL